LQEFQRIVPCQVGDRAHYTLAPDDLVGECGNVAHVDAAEDDGSAFVHGPKRGGNEISDGREDDRGIERGGRRLIGLSGPYAAERRGKFLRLTIARPRERVYAAAW
jgi:hypothetical protein